MTLIEVITVSLQANASVADWLAANAAMKDAYVSQQAGYLARETAASAAGQWRIAVDWESKAASDASIAGFGAALGLESFMSHLDAESMVIKQYATQHGRVETSLQPAGATEVITLRLQDGADVAAFLTANQAIESAYVSQQPGFVARRTGVTEDGEWMIAVHWESAEDSAASIAGFGAAPGVEAFMAFIDAESMVITVYNIEQ